MAGTNFHVPLALFFIALTMFDHCKATPPPETDPSRANISSSITGNATSSMEPPQPTEAPTRPPNMQHCSDYLPLLPRNNRSCTDGNGKMPHSICFPLALSDGFVDVGRNLSIKPSRRFRISVPDPETNEGAETCPTKAESRNIGAEFMHGQGTLLEDYHQMFMDLVEDLGWPECRMMVSTEGTTRPTNATTTEKTETTTTTTTKQTTPTTTPMTTTTPTTMTTTTTSPAVLPVNEVPKSRRLANALRNGCNITIAGTLPQNGTFEIHLLHNTPEPIPGIGETLLKFDVRSEMIRAETRFHPIEAREYERKHWLKDDRDKIELIVNIGVIDNGYIVYFGGKEFGLLQNHDPLWAINYTYITGDLILKEKNPVNVQCAREEEPSRTGSVDWSNNLDIEKPTDIVFRDLQFNGNGSLVVYLLKGCAKFDMTVCNLAMEFELKFRKDAENKTSSQLNINLHRRSSEDARKSAEVLKIPISQDQKYNVTMSLYDGRRTGLMVHGHGWQHSEAGIGEMDEEWKQTQRITNKDADFVQILTKGAVEVGTWTLYTAPRPVMSMNSKGFQPGETSPPWNMEQKLTNWANGDYIKLHIRMSQKETNAVQLIFYRGGEPEWIDNKDKSDEFGQIMLYMEINQLDDQSDAQVVFKSNNCPWINSKERKCPSQQLDMEMPKLPDNQLKRFQDGQEYVLHIKAVKNKDNKQGNYANGLQVEVFDPNNNNTLLATYTPMGGPPAYAIEHFTVEKGDLELMELPKFCRKGANKMC